MNSYLSLLCQFAQPDDDFMRLYPIWYQIESEIRDEAVNSLVVRSPAALSALARPGR